MPPNMGPGSRPPSYVIQATGMPKSELDKLYSECETLKTWMKVTFSRDRHLSTETTHLIVGKLRPTEKLISAMVRGIWILPQSYLAKSLGHRKWWPESEQDFGQRSGKFYHGGFFIPPKGHRMAVNPFSGWSVVVLLDDLEDREKYHRILVNGLAVVHRMTVDNLLDSLQASHPINQVHLTHIFTDGSKFRPEKLNQLLALVSSRPTPIPLLSVHFIVEVIIRQAKPDPRDFEALSPRMVELHHDLRRQLDEEPPHDYLKLGSPSFALKQAPEPGNRRSSGSGLPLRREASAQNIAAKRPAGQEAAATRTQSSISARRTSSEASDYSVERPSFSPLSNAPSPPPPMPPALQPRAASRQPPAYSRPPPAAPRQLPPAWQPRAAHRHPPPAPRHPTATSRDPPSPMPPAWQSRATLRQPQQPAPQQLPAAPRQPTASLPPPSAPWQLLPAAVPPAALPPPALWPQQQPQPPALWPQQQPQPPALWPQEQPQPPALWPQQQPPALWPQPPAPWPQQPQQPANAAASEPSTDDVDFRQLFEKSRLIERRRLQARMKADPEIEIVILDDDAA